MWWPHLREFRFWNQGIFSLWNLESWALESGIKLNKSGIPLTIDWNPESKFHWQRSGIHDVESRIQYCLGFSYVGRDIRKKFKGVAHSNENTSSRFCLNVLKLMIWTGSISMQIWHLVLCAYQKIGFAVQTLNKLLRWTKATLYYFISLASSTSLAYEQALYFGGFARSHVRTDTSSRGFASFSHVLSRL